MSVYPYLQLMRLNKPIGIYLLLWPALFGLVCASHGRLSFKLIIIFTLGAVLMRSAGCAINDFADKDIDKNILRTSTRPLAVNSLTTRQALITTAILVICAASLLLFLPYMVSLWALLAAFFTVLYPFTKRCTYYPQLFLALSFAIPIPMAYVASEVPINISTLVLYLATFIWTVVYDTFYAMADKPEDLQSGVKSIAIKLGNHDRAVLAILQFITLLLFTLLGFIKHLKFFYFSAILISAGIMLYQQYLIRKRDSKQCFQAFYISHYVTLALLVAAALDLIYTTSGVSINNF